MIDVSISCDAKYTLFAIVSLYNTQYNKASHYTPTLNTTVLNRPHLKADSRQNDLPWSQSFSIIIYYFSCRGSIIMGRHWVP